VKSNTLTARILAALDPKFGYTATHLAHKLNASPATVSSILNRLAKAGRVYRKRFDEVNILVRSRTYRGGMFYFK
jgi:DNA-binding MarR family transcriptional regulator